MALFSSLSKVSTASGSGFITSLSCRRSKLAHALTNTLKVRHKNIFSSYFAAHRYISTYAHFRMDLFSRILIPGYSVSGVMTATMTLLFCAGRRNGEPGKFTFEAQPPCVWKYKTQSGTNDEDKVIMMRSYAVTYWDSFCYHGNGAKTPVLSLQQTTMYLRKL